MPHPSLPWLLLLVCAVSTGAAFAACSSNKEASHDGGLTDASVDADDDGSLDVAAPPDDVPIYPEAPSLLSPDGCFRQGAACMDDTTCCSAYCVDGGCTLMPRQM